MDQLINNVEETSERPTFEMLPTNILIKIFSYLPPADVLLMHHVNNLCRAVLKMDLRFMKEGLSKVAIRNFGGEDKMNFRSKRHTVYVQLEGIRLILRFLRIFWREIIVINISNLRSNEFWQEIVFSYIIEYRRAQVVNLTICYLTIDFDFPIQSFDNVLCIRFKSCYFSSYLSNISSLFPNAKNVEFLKMNDIEDATLHKIINFSLPKLQYMKISPLSISRSLFDLMKLLNPHVYFGYHDKN